MSSPITSVVPVTASRRVLGRFTGAEPGPLLIAIGSLHGNEAAGVKALRAVSTTLERHDEPLARGDFVALAGNLGALTEGRRYLDSDLNRHWTAERIRRIATEGPSAECAEDAELRALYDEIAAVRTRARGPIFLLDLHSTSAASPPFATVPRSPAALQFALGFGVPVVEGLNEGLSGTLLDYVEFLGMTAIGFEGGRHEDPATVEAVAALLWSALGRLGLLAPEPTELQLELGMARRNLARAVPPLAPLFEVVYRYALTDPNAYRMQPGFSGFQTVARGELLGTDRGSEIRATQDGLVLMPLYQSQGYDGFFLMREHSALRRLASRVASRLPLDALLPHLPGVRRDLEDPLALRVTPRWTEGLRQALPLVLGYRSRQLQPDGWTLLQRRTARPFSADDLA